MASTAPSGSSMKNGEKSEDLDRLALEEIMKETNRAKERAETMGPMGWVKCPLQPTNKRFFRNVLMRTITDSKRGTAVNRRKEIKKHSLDANTCRFTQSSGELDRKRLKIHPPARSPKGNRSSEFSERKYIKDEQSKRTLKKQKNKTKRDVMPIEHITPDDKQERPSRKHKLHHKSKQKRKRKKSR